MTDALTIREDGTVEGAFALTPAWHDLGVVVTDPEVLADYERFMHISNVDWEVVQRKVAWGKPSTIETPDGPTDTVLWTEDPEQFCNVRADNGFKLGYVSKNYKVAQNVEIFRFLASLIEDATLQFESAFSLFGGKKVVVTAKLPGVDEIITNDNIARYIMMSTSHDGDGGIRFGCVSTRIVCWNTYSVALDETDGKGKRVRELSIPHTGNLEEKLDQAREIIGRANDNLDKYADQARQLVDYRISDDEWKTYLDVLCPIPDEADPDYTERRVKALTETREAIEANFRTDPRQQLEGVKGTAWAAFNAVTQHVDHLPRRGATKTRRAEARFNVALYGAGRDAKERAFRTACRIAQVAL